MDCNKVAYIDRTFDVAALIHTGFLQSGMSYQEIEDRICRFFGIRTIYEYDFIISPDKYGVPIIADLNTFSIN